MWRSVNEAPFAINGLSGFYSNGVYPRLPIKTPAPLPEAVDRLEDCPDGVFQAVVKGNPRLPE